jgi:uncharacterized protein (TIGR01777 family)
MTSNFLWSLILLQTLMGAFDTLYHHELTERLAWRQSQRRELGLHGVRNLIYAALFLTFGLIEPQGLCAIVLIVALGIEVLITLIDFIEEDRSRRLPATERVTHALLALNYGAILALAAPVLLGWAQKPTGTALATHGFWTLFALASGLGVALFGLRDLLASRRLAVRATPDAATLVAAIGTQCSILVTGATGFIGTRLVEALSAAGHSVFVLARDPAKAAGLKAPFTLVTALDQIGADTRIDAIVNLAGEPIADRPWTKARREEIVASRVGMTRDVVRLVERLERKPAVLVNGSAIGWYGLRGDEQLTETSWGVDCFSREICEAWEYEALAARTSRVVRLRIGLVLGTEGGMLARLLLPFEFGLGGRIGDGRQWMSWIARDDLVGLIAHVIATPSLSGAVNATAPIPVDNATFARVLGKVLHRPAILPLPGAPLRLALGDFARELLLGGQRVLPAKALASGFRFRHETLSSALDEIICGRVRSVEEGSHAKDAVVPQRSRATSSVSGLLLLDR